MTKRAGQMGTGAGSYEKAWKGTKKPIGNSGKGRGLTEGREIRLRGSVPRQACFKISVLHDGSVSRKVSAKISVLKDRYVLR